MRTHRTGSALALFIGLLTGIALPAAPAWAGGLGAGILSPAVDNGCANHDWRSTARGGTTTAAGAAGGDRVAVPVAGPLNQCGGADVPVSLDQLLKKSIDIQGGQATIGELMNAAAATNRVTFDPAAFE
ncbi:hypothetical protein AB0F13_08890 [Streptomyces sp. NPDC026206]|uniref:hypothetical protein n=1 Tax=Streptomyces sp. NPDC026206 TaxID=3157089 RepID=UPI0033EC644D